MLLEQTLNVDEQRNRREQMRSTCLEDIAASLIFSPLALHMYWGILHASHSRSHTRSVQACASGGKRSCNSRWVIVSTLASGHHCGWQNYFPAHTIRGSQEDPRRFPQRQVTAGWQLWEATGILQNLAGNQPRFPS
jgi:hypothetical protein